MGAVLILIGVGCMIAAIVGGGVKLQHLEVGAVPSLRRQGLLGAFGLVVSSFGFAINQDYFNLSNSGKPASATTNAAESINDNAQGPANGAEPINANDIRVPSNTVEVAQTPVNNSIVPPVEGTPTGKIEEAVRSGSPEGSIKKTDRVASSNAEVRTVAGERKLRTTTQETPAPAIAATDQRKRPTAELRATPSQPASQPAPYWTKISAHLVTADEQYPGSITVKNGRIDLVLTVQFTQAGWFGFGKINGNSFQVTGSAWPTYKSTTCNGMIYEKYSVYLSCSGEFHFTDKLYRLQDITTDFR